MVISITGLCGGKHKQWLGLAEGSPSLFFVPEFSSTHSFSIHRCTTEKMGYSGFSISGGLLHADLQEGGVAQLVRAQAS
tara:strand:- start:47 stop:283 length:237 start_codon:yes stop_codon:yes gene_type:complete